MNDQVADPHVMAATSCAKDELVTDPIGVATACRRKAPVDDRQKGNSANQAEMMAFMLEPTLLHRDRRPKSKTPPGKR